MSESNKKQFFSAQSYKWWVLSVVEISIFLLGIDITAVTLALPAMTHYYQISLDYSQWILTIYFVATALALPIAGKCSDIFKRKTVYIVGFALYTLGSLFTVLSPNLTCVLISRMIMGFGSASLLANTNVITISVFPRHQQGIALGTNNAVFSLGFALGYLPGGYLIEHFGWQSIFWINVPIGLLACLFASLILKENLLSKHHHKDPPFRFDYFGAFLSVIAIGGLLLGFHGWVANGLSLLTISLFAFSLCGFTAFIFHELRFPSPLLEIRLLKNHIVTRGLFLRLAIQIINASCLVIVPFYCNIVLQLTPIETGYLMLPYALSFSIFGPLSGYLTNLFGSRFVLVSGTVASGVGLIVFALMAQVGQVTNMIILLTVALFILGLTMGLIVAPNNQRILSSVPATHRGAVSAIIWFVILLGNSIGSTFSSTMVQDGIAAFKASNSIQNYMTYQTMTFNILLILSLIGFLFAIIKLKEKPGTHHASET